MTNSFSTLLVGLGSPHGDDQLGWRIAQVIEPGNRPNLMVRVARSPIEVLSWLEGVNWLIVCDACQGAGTLGSWHHWHWPTDDLVPLHFAGSHDLGLAAVLTLADRLGQLPEQVSIWAIEADLLRSSPTSIGAGLSAEVERAVPQVVRLIEEELIYPSRKEALSSEPSQRSD